MTAGLDTTLSIIVLLVSAVVSFLVVYHAKLKDGAFIWFALTFLLTMILMLFITCL